jgi:hypothetical protein
MKTIRSIRYFKRSTRLFILIAILLSSYGCGDNLETNTPTLKPMWDWIAAFLYDPPCDFPCWENITPGKTSMEDASRIVESRKDIEGFSGLNNSPLDDSTGFYWNFTNNEGRGYIESDQNGLFVNLIKFQYSHEISYIIDKYGNPDKIFIISGRRIDSYEYYLLYTEIGLRLEGGSYTENPYITITSRTGIISIVLTTPEGLIENLQKFGNYQDSLYEWNGYGEYTLGKE